MGGFLGQLPRQVVWLICFTEPITIRILAQSVAVWLRLIRNRKHLHALFTIWRVLISGRSLKTNWTSLKEIQVLELLAIPIRSPSY